MERGQKYLRGFWSIFLSLLCGLSLTTWSGVAYGNGENVSQQPKKLLEITYDNRAKQVVPLDQPSNNIMMMEYKSTPEATASQNTHQAILTKGWDIMGDPLSAGQVGWIVNDGQGSNNLKVAFQLSGAKPNHEYTVGVHLFNPTNPTARPNVTGFGGWAVGGEGVVNREGKSAYAIAYDFGGLRTDPSGNGFAQFTLSAPQGIYHLQFTVRIGAVNTCRTSQGITHGCSVVYRSGSRYSERLETLQISSPYSAPTQQSNDLLNFLKQGQSLFK